MFGWRSGVRRLRVRCYQPGSRDASVPGRAHYEGLPYLNGWTRVRWKATKAVWIGVA